MAKYKVFVSFKTDRALADDELEYIAAGMAIQAEEPVGRDGHEIHVKTSGVKVKVKSVHTRDLTEAGPFTRGG